MQKLHSNDVEYEWKTATTLRHVSECDWSSDQVFSDPAHGDNPDRSDLDDDDENVLGTHLFSVRNLSFGSDFGEISFHFVIFRSYLQMSVEIKIIFNQ